MANNKKVFRFTHGSQKPHGNQKPHDNHDKESNRNFRKSPNCKGYREYDVVKEQITAEGLANVYRRNYSRTIS